LCGVWWKLLQNFIRDFKGLEPSEEPLRIKDLRAALAKRDGFETVESEGAEELLASRCEDVAVADLQTLVSEA
jgi:hypothetical protein